MKVEVKRIARKPKYTIGHLYLDGVYICDTLEDTDRSLTLDMSIKVIKDNKVYGETAIPMGTYKVTMNIVSPKFKNTVWGSITQGRIPRILDVPGFDGVLIHPGNTPKDTLGCILLGYNKAVGKVIDSVKAYNYFINKVRKEKEFTLKIY